VCKDLAIMKSIPLKEYGYSRLGFKFEIGLLTVKHTINIIKLYAFANFLCINYLSSVSEKVPLQGNKLCSKRQ
jgi:hypothetical protein